MLALYLMALAPVSAAGPKNAAFLNCITSSAGAFLAKSSSRSAYERHIDTACAGERQRLRDYIIAKQTGAGRLRSEAEGDADEFFEIIRVQLLDLLPIDAR
ncbi:MAG TPA: hypothetical protein VFI88_02630 [Sphingomicrobium sp.]|nr:hypothetical protein [Sphingomicrobium sp.]